MFWDWVYAIGGYDFMNTVSDIILPFYDWVWDMAANGDPIFTSIATFLEMIFT